MILVNKIAIFLHYYLQLIIRNSEICVESYMKKEEFGGGKAVIRENSCEGIFREDKNSKITL